VRISFNGRLALVPDFLLGGAARSGTTTLYSYLHRTRGIFMAREKEPHFFLAWGRRPYFKDDRCRFPADYISYAAEKYLDGFKDASSEDAIGEASSWYLYAGDAAVANIRRLYGPQARRVKLLFILRDPVGRAWSHYWLKRTRGEEHLSFSEAIRPDVVRDRLSRGCSVAFDYIGQGLYSRKLELFLESFDAVRVFLSDDLRLDPAGTLRGIYDFLGVRAQLPTPKTRTLNASGIPRGRAAAALSRLVYQPHSMKSVFKVFIPRSIRYDLKNRLGAHIFRKPALDPSLRRELNDFFREDVRRLGKLIGRDLGPWLAEPGSGAENGSERSARGRP
jgi:hypothetical protein